MSFWLLQLAVLILTTLAAPAASSNAWTAVATTGAPGEREYHTAVWTGNEMIVWGGVVLTNPSYLKDGGRYDPVSETWTSVIATSGVAGRYLHTAVWTGTEMIVWGGYGIAPQDTLGSGARYNPTNSSWSLVNTNGNDAPGPRGNHTAIWTGSEMIVWGGFGGNTTLSDGSRYDPTVDRWTRLPFTGSPVARSSHTAVWTGSEMIIWGGVASLPANSGGRYNPSSNQWTTVTNAGAPGGRFGHAAIWTGSEMIIWGGADFAGAFNDGARYNPVSNTWTPMATDGAPSARFYHSTVWTGSEMIIWGGKDGSGHLFNNGARYNPATDSWTTLARYGAPGVRNLHTAVWTGSEMIVWGGVITDDGNQFVNDGGVYNPAADVLPPLSLAITGTNSFISWTTAEPGLILQQADTLNGSTSWTDSSDLISTNGLTNLLQQPLESGVSNRFYRLRRP
ncbi:MAG TPA: hypothetical protein VI454_10805 [Verrucomicrobiae bacterium]|jgi:N-acetylneuraminic acid mutarotase